MNHWKMTFLMLSLTIHMLSIRMLRCFNSLTGGFLVEQSGEFLEILVQEDHIYIINHHRPSPIMEISLVDQWNCWENWLWRVALLHQQ